MVFKRIKIIFFFMVLFISTLIICNAVFNGLTLRFQSKINQDVQIFEGVDYKDYAEDLSWRFLVKEGENEYQIPLRGIRIQKFRVDLAGENSILLQSITSKNFFGIADCKLDPEYFYEVNIERKLEGLEIRPINGAKDPYVSIRCKNTFQNVIIVKNIFFGALIFCAQLIFILFVAQLYKKANEVNLYFRLNLLLKRLAKTPITTIFIFSLASVVLSHNQVIAFKKSNVAPLGTSLIYSGNPSLPNYSFERIYDYHGSDTGAMMWQHIPYTFLVGDAINQYREIPLWNRFNGAGRSLIGQGQAMIAEPLNLIIAITGFTAEKYDLKYIVLKLIFSFSLGLIVYFGTSRVWTASLIGFLSTFISFYLFRLNHPAYFTMAYGPLILLAYAYAARGIRGGQIIIFSIALFFGNWLVITSGTGKEAFLTAIIYNAIGFLWIVTLNLKKYVYLIWAATNLFFAIISSPIWFSFLSYVVGEKSGYATPLADQYTPNQFIYFGENLGFLATGGYQPALNFPIFFLFILGLLFLLGSKDFRSKGGIVFGVSSVLLLLCAYGAVPKWIFLVTPFINSVHHITDVFSSIAVAPSIILAGYSAAFLSADLDRLKKYKTYFIAVILALLFSSYYESQGLFNSVQIIFTIYCLLSLYLFFAFMAVIKDCQKGSLKFGNILFLSAILLFSIFRGMQWPNTSWAIKDYVFIPSPRTNLKPDFDLVKNWREMSQKDPMRAIGTEGTMFSGYRAIYGIESIDGPDALFPKYYRKLSESLQMPYGWYWRMEFNNERVIKRLPALSFLNVGYVFSEFKLTGLGSPLMAGKGINIYQLKRAWPRAFFISCAEEVSGEQILEKINKRITREKPFLLLERKDSSSTPESKECINSQVSPAFNYALTANKTMFEVAAPTSGYIYLAENYEDGNFIARINGDEQEIQRGNYAFKAIKVNKPGLYRVEVEYAPKGFYTLLQIAKIGFVCYLALLICLVGFFFGSKFLRCQK